MSQAHNAYTRIQQQTQSPRELEATLLMKAASRLQGIADNWDARRHDMDEALTYNRKLWTVLFTSVTSPESQLPVEIKLNIAQLANFIFNHTMSLITDERPERLAVLISINRDIAAGLRTRPEAPPEVPGAA
jgi:flagellar biosynthesis activator protein FlaF